MKSGQAVEIQNTFKYKGLSFVPFKKLKTHEADFHVVSKKLRDIKITPSGWNWNKFYEAAKKANPDNAQIDLFICNGRTVIPCENTLFGYEE